MNDDKTACRVWSFILGILPRNNMIKEGGALNLSMSKIEVKMRQRINRKFEKVGAISKKNAVPLMEANLDLQEQYWLPYLVGSVLGSIRKTSDNRYYYC